MAGAYIEPVEHDYVLTASDDLEQPDNPVLQSMVIRLLTWRGSCWWDLNFGSTLHLMPTEKLSGSIERDAETRAADALQPMLDAGELLELEVSAERVDRNRLELSVRCTDAGRRPLSFTRCIEV